MNNQSMRNGFVRVNNGGVYKGVEASYTGRKLEYVEKKNHSFLSLIVVSLPLIPIAIVIINHMPK